MAPKSAITGITVEGPRLASHSKKLTDAEVVDGKEYVKKVLANYKKAVADGTSDKKKEPTNENKTQGKG